MTTLKYKLLYTPEDMSLEDTIAGRQFEYEWVFDEEPDIGGSGPNFGGPPFTPEWITTTYSYVNPTPEEYRYAPGSNIFNPWRHLHRYWGTDPLFLEWWEPYIPVCGDCRRFYADYKSKNPPNFSSPRKFWEWGVDLHNAVNQKLNYPVMDYATAYRLWQSRYVLWQPIHYGGLERWAISLSTHLPSFGTVIDTFSDTPVKDELLTLSPETPWRQAIPFDLPVIMSCIKDFPRLPVPTVLVAHGYCDWTKKWVMSSYEQCDHLVGVSEQISEHLREWTGRPVTTIYNGIDTNRLTCTLSQEEARARLGIPKDVFVIGYTGRLAPEKRIGAILETIARYPRAWGLLCGWNYNNDIYKQLETLGIQDRVLVAPASAAVGNHLRAMDVFVSTPSTEGFGLSVMEAMMFGLPVVSTNLGILRDLSDIHGPNYGPGLLPEEFTTSDILHKISIAKPCKLDLSEFTSVAMAERWKQFLAHITPNYQLAI